MNQNPSAFGAFNQGVIPNIACFNKAATPLGVDLDALIAALQAYVDQHVTPIWGTPCKLVKSTDFIKGAWAIVFLDDADVPNAYAYHELTPDGLPISKVFVRTILNAPNPTDRSISLNASHELVEMLVDPAINMYTTGPSPYITYTYDKAIPVPAVGAYVNALYAYESADPVEEVTFKVNGMDMSDFVYPAYFELFREPSSVQFDHENKITTPFQVLSGGYQIIFIDGQFTSVFGSKAKAKRFAQEDRRGHRSEMRFSGKLRRSSTPKI